MAYTFKKGILPTEEIGYFEEMNPGWKCTGETLEEELTDSRGFVHGCTYAVMTGKWTPYGMCRDCGSHYIIARWMRIPNKAGCRWKRIPFREVGRD